MIATRRRAVEVHIPQRSLTFQRHILTSITRSDEDRQAIEYGTLRGISEAQRHSLTTTRDARHTSDVH